MNVWTLSNITIRSNYYLWPFGVMAPALPPKYALEPLVGRFPHSCNRIISINSFYVHDHC